MGLFGPNINKMLAEKDVPGLKKVILEEKNQKNQAKAIAALAELKEVEALISMMTGPELTIVLVPVLAKMGDDAYPHLVKALDENSYWVPGGAATALSAMNRQQAVDPIINRLQDPACMAKIPMIVALGELGGEKAKQALELAVLDKNPEVSRAAAQKILDLVRKGQ